MDSRQETTPPPHDRRLVVGLLVALVAAVAGATADRAINPARVVVQSSPSPVVVTSYVVVTVTPDPGPPTDDEGETPEMSETPSSPAKTTPPPPPDKTTVAMPKPLYLAEATPADTEWGYYGTGEATIQGDPFKHTVMVCVSDGSDGISRPVQCKVSAPATAGWVEYNLGAQHKRFTAVVGLTSESSSNCSVDVEITLMGGELYKGAFRYGDRKTVTRETRGKERLRLSVTNKVGNICVVGFGDAAATN